MSPELSIKADWVSADTGPAEERTTSALLSISVEESIATRVIDDWSRSVHDWVRLSAYPLALWCAASWWRLRWEPAPESARRTVSWRMAHEVTGAGRGFLWPQLTFDSDGENVELSCKPSRASSTEPVRYLSTFRRLLPANSFEHALDAFVNLTVQRLDDEGIRETPLHSLWKELLEERGDSGLAAYRRIEAMLGFEPGEGPEQLIANFAQLSAHAGEGAILQVVSACAGPKPAAALTDVRELADAPGVHGRVNLPSGLNGPAPLEEGPPWIQGRRLAEKVRAALGLQPKPISDKDLSELLGVRASDLAPEAAAHGRNIRLTLGVRQPGADGIKLLFRKRNRPGRRFEAARLLADHLMAPQSDRWLPAADTKTSRQKRQRAFAAEFTCPIVWLQNELGGDFSNESIEDAAEKASVSPLAVRSNLANHGLMPPEDVDAGDVADA